MGGEERLHPIAFYTTKFSAMKMNYEIHNKDVLNGLLITKSFVQEIITFAKGILRSTKNDYLETETSSSSCNHYVESNGFFIP